jgi:hypothetical protein
MSQNSKFLRLAAKLGAAAAIGLSSCGGGSESGINEEALQTLVTEAQESGDLVGAITRHWEAAGLTEEQVTVLKGLTAEDLKDLQSVLTLLESGADAAKKAPARRG